MDRPQPPATGFYDADADVYASHVCFFCWCHGGAFDGEMFLVRAREEVPPAQLSFRWNDRLWLYEQQGDMIVMRLSSGELHRRLDFYLL